MDSDVILLAGLDAKGKVESALTDNKLLQRVPAVAEKRLAYFPGRRRS